MANPFGDVRLKEVRVDRPDEGLPGVADKDNPTANPPTRGSFQPGTADKPSHTMQQSVIDTTETSRLPVWEAVKKARPSVF